MRKHPFVRPLLLVALVSGALAGSSSARAEKIVRPGSTCVAAFGTQVQYVGTTICPQAGVDAWARCLYALAPTNVEWVDMRLRDRRSDHAVICTVTGTTDGNVTYGPQQVHSGTPFVGDIAVATEEEGNNFTKVVEALCYMPQDNGGGQNCVKGFDIVVR